MASPSSGWQGSSSSEAAYLWRDQAVTLPQPEASSGYLQSQGDRNIVLHQRNQLQRGVDPYRQVASLVSFQRRQQGQQDPTAGDNIDIRPSELGLKVLFMPNRADRIQADIVAVHGIGVHPSTAWTFEKDNVNWLEDKNMLQADCPTARIFAFGYDSIFFGESPVRQTLDGVARKLLSALKSKRKDSKRRPIVFVGHCFGGLVIQHDEYPGIYSSVTGVVSLGTPYDGTSLEMTLEEIYRAVANAGWSEDKELLNNLIRGNSLLVNLVHAFTKHISMQDVPPQLCCFFEKRPTRFGVIAGIETKREFVVDELSGTLRGHRKLGLELDHFGISKFEGPDDNHYESVSSEIKAMVDKSTKIMKARHKRSGSSKS